ncbi:MAG: sigma-70 family RNA polymerase sigma factor [Lachnospiraceae bacterium]
MTDEKLFQDYIGNEREITDILMEKYKYLVRSLAKDLFLPGADHEDLIQEGMIGLFKAIRDFDKEKNVKFITFATVCITRQMYTAIESAQRNKHIPLNNYLPIEYLQEEQEPLDVKSIPEMIVLEKEKTEYLSRLFETQLTELEQDVLKLYLTGRTTKEIATILDRSEKSTDNALQRLKAKLKRTISTIFEY